ncbi:MAG: CopG family transcriptional regulator [Acidimicrobiales bacterium]
MNLRLSPEVEDAVRSAARRSGRSQQEVIREAIACHLGLVTKEGGRSELDELVSTGVVRPPRTPARTAGQRLKLP